MDALSDKGVEIKISLSFYKPIGNENGMYAEIDVDVYKFANEIWENSIYMYVTSKHTYYVHLNAFVKHEWLLKGK